MPDVGNMWLYNHLNTGITVSVSDRQDGKDRTIEKKQSRLQPTMTQQLWQYICLLLSFIIFELFGELMI